MAEVYEEKGGEIGITRVQWLSMPTHSAKFLLPHIASSNFNVSLLRLKKSKRQNLRRFRTICLPNLRRLDSFAIGKFCSRPPENLNMREQAQDVKMHAKWLTCVTEHFFFQFKKSAVQYLVVPCFLNRVFIMVRRGAQKDETSVWKTVVFWTLTYK